MKLYSYFFASLIALFVFSCQSNDDALPPVNYDQDEASLTSAGWKKVFEEDFSSDFSKWNVWNGGAYNNEYQCYRNDTNNIKIRNGVLIINAIKGNVTGPTTNNASTTKAFGFTSGRIESKTTISASTATPQVRVSARIKLPTGYGMWPAFWSYGDSWPQNGEIDILEARGNEPFIYGTNYFYGPTQQNLVSGAEKVIKSFTSLTEYWHVYEVIWEKESLTFYLDGKVVDTKLASTTSGQYIDKMFGKVQNVILNLAVGGDYFQLPDASTIQTGTMQVDWVRVYNK